MSKIKAKNTKYLKWETENGVVTSVVLTVQNGVQMARLRLKPHTQIESPLDGRLQKFKLVDYDFELSGLPTVISKQLARYVIPFRQEADRDIMRIDFENIEI